MTKSAFVHALNVPLSVLSDGQSGMHHWAHVSVETRVDLSRLLHECSGRGVSVVIGKPRNLNKESADISNVLFVDLQKLDSVIEHSLPDQVISVETGMTMRALQTLLNKTNQWWPVAAFPESTIYDVIASGDGGVLEHGFSGPRHLVLGLELALPNGNIIKTGGKVVKNVTGYDMTKLIVGCHGTLGIPCVAHLRLFAKPHSSATMVAFSENLPELVSLAQTFMSSGMPMAVLEIVDKQEILHCIPDQAREQFNTGLLGQHTYVLVCQVYEHEQVIAEVLPQLRLLIPDSIHHALLPAAGTELFLDALSAASDAYIEVNCPASMMAAIVREAERVCKPVSARLRPGAGRLRLHCQDSSAHSSLVGVLRNFCTKNQVRLPVAEISDGSIAVHQLPERQEAVDDIARSLKHQLDPQRCLNPFVNNC